MSAPEGNQFWKQRSKHGRDKLFSSSELLWEAACEYFQWCDEHPLQKQEAFAFQGVVTKEDLDLLRAYTMTGLCLYLDCGEKYFYNFKGEKDFEIIIERIKKIIYDQKFTGAASGLFNANIIARDLGLKDSTDITTDGEKINIPHNVSYKGEDVTPKEDV